MSQWFRIFAARDAAVEPAALLEHLHAQGLEVSGHFRGDDLGWFRAELVFAEDAPPVQLDRYLVKEEEIRGELNSWAAWLEEQEDNPHHARLMEQVIAAVQLFTLHQPIEEADDLEDAAFVERLCTACCRFLARETDGIYQVDRRGFFTADGTLLVPE
jgi:hypothetical protein